MNYRTKIPIPLFSDVIPVGSKISRYKNGDYYYELNGSKYFFSEFLVCGNPDIFEPDRTWTDEEMIEFRYRYCLSPDLDYITTKKDILNHFAKFKGK